MNKSAAATQAALITIACALVFSPPLRAQFSGGGAPGAAGSKIWMGPGVPSGSLGSDTDVDVDTSSGNVYQKDAGAWVGPTMNLTGPAGPTGGFSAFSQPSTRSFAFATAYQCTDNTKPCLLTITLTSSASFSLLAGVSNTADVVIGTTSGVATSGGVAVAKYSNTLTSSLAIGINTATVSNATYVLHMPAGAFMAVRLTAGTVTVVNSSVEQTVT